MSEENKAPSLDFEGKRIFVNNLSFKTTWQGMKDFFNEKVGNVVYADVFTFGKAKKSKGCGVVEFETNELAIKAVRELNGATLDDREIFLREDREQKEESDEDKKTLQSRGTRGTRGTRGARGTRGTRGGRQVRSSRPEAPKKTETGGGSGKQIFVGNLTWQTTEESIMSKFSEFGTVASAKVEKDMKGRSRGYATVLFETKEQADAAVKATNGTEFDGRELNVHVDKFYDDGETQE